MFFCLRGGSQNSTFSQFRIFPKLGRGGGGDQISDFSSFQKSPKHPGVGYGCFLGCLVGGYSQHGHRLEYGWASCMVCMCLFPNQRLHQENLHFSHLLLKLG